MAIGGMPEGTVIGCASPGRPTNTRKKHNESRQNRSGDDGKTLAPFTMKYHRPVA